MTDITQMEIDNPIDIWNYVKKLTESKIVDRKVYENELVEYVFRNDSNTFDQVLLPTDLENVYLVIIIDLKENKIFGHRQLDLSKKYETK